MNTRQSFELQHPILKSATSFPEYHAAGEMRPHSQTIHIHCGTGQDVSNCQNSQFHMERARPTLETIFHELTHWYDLIGTHWGRNYLDLLFECLDIMIDRPNTAEDEFYKIIRLYDENRRVLFPSYYHMVLQEDQEHSRNKPWQIQFSCGVEFDAYGRQNYERPLFFVKFGDHDSGKLIARQPLSIGALLETRAIASELRNCAENTALVCQNEQEYSVSFNINLQQKSKILYDKNLTLYTGPAHLLSVWVGTKDFYTTYIYGSALASVALNLKKEHFRRIKHPSSFGVFGTERLAAFGNSLNRGYAFAAIAKQAPKFDESVDVDSWLSAALEAANLPSQHVIFSDALEEFVEKSNTVKTERLEITSAYLRELGREYLGNISAEGHYYLDMRTIQKTECPIPFMFDANGELFSLAKPVNSSKFDAVEMFEYEHAFMDFRNNFLKAARGIGPID